MHTTALIKKEILLQAKEKEEKKEDEIQSLVKILESRLITSRYLTKEEFENILIKKIKKIHPQTTQEEIVETLDYVNSERCHFDKAINNLQNPFLIIYILENRLDVTMAIRLSELQATILTLPENMDKINRDIYTSNKKIPDIIAELLQLSLKTDLEKKNPSNFFKEAREINNSQASEGKHCHRLLRRLVANEGTHS